MCSDATYTWCSQSKPEARSLWNRIQSLKLNWINCLKNSKVFLNKNCWDRYFCIYCVYYMGQRPRSYCSCVVLMTRTVQKLKSKWFLNIFWIQSSNLMGQDPSHLNKYNVYKFSLNANKRKKIKNETLFSSRLVFKFLLNLWIIYPSTKSGTDAE